jgi:hypothetical protein
MRRLPTLTIARDRGLVPPGTDTSIKNERRAQDHEFDFELAVNRHSNRVLGM